MNEPKSKPHRCPRCGMRAANGPGPCSCEMKPPRKTTCPACNGTGSPGYSTGDLDDPHREAEDCQRCGGHGKVEEPGLIDICKAASAALRSYQYGNSSPDLAKEIADSIDAAITKAKGATT